MKLAVVSLGCPKNQVDADRFCRALLEAGHTTVATIEEADVAIINTCGFIESAKEEAIEHILDACAMKTHNPDLRVVVTGCLAERYREELAREIPEVDAVVGIGSNGRLPAILEELCARQAEAPPLECYAAKQGLPLEGPRIIGTPRHYAWLKIAEGCSNACAYCAIPAIRGGYRSRPLQNVVEEARWLAAQGVKELVLVAQDVTAYGENLGQNLLVSLLRELDKLEGVRWVRLLYAYPEKITQQLLVAMAESEKALPYIDLPIQHCNEEILRSMGRRGGRAAIEEALRLIRENLPGATLRTSLIAGYPGESEPQFEELCAFVQQAGFDRLGCFAYSEEEGTRAARMKQLPIEERQRRADAVMRLQSGILAQKQQVQVGCTLQVLCDEYDPEEDVWLCRTAADAPEIDTNVLVPGAQPLQEGEFFLVKVTDTDGADLYAILPDSETS
ncbi:30S ribosomal protein S12 methylthiotransferase RimO [Ruminococcaceae bacterium OttesenSCG-928-O06]|nr:30S ribosomal protein S12 methylthiotransferase RimO [Ruminococcaceae bacterium OttesenSCG-928-O06]